MTLYFASDLHLDHENIIEYCERPFDNCQSMNKKLKENWNERVNENDTVVFLGDLTMSEKKKKLKSHLNSLNGRKILVKGNHDKFDISEGFVENCTIKYNYFEFYCTHRFKDVPSDWDNWSLTGHHHNNYPNEYPLCHPGKKNLNLSVELTDYSPISISEIINMIKDKSVFRDYKDYKSKF